MSETHTGEAMSPRERKPSNPPLFVIHHDDAGGGIEINITLRDLFAAAALGLNGEYFHYQQASEPQTIAAVAYAIADAMLREREKP